MKIYISSGALLLLAIVYLPFVLWFLTKVWRSVRWRKPLKIIAVAGLFLVAAAVPLWDVVVTSVEMAQLCPASGIFVKKIVHVTGFYTNLGSREMLSRGFKYVETNTLGNRLVVYTKNNDRVEEQQFDRESYRIKSRYEFIYDAEKGALGGHSRIGIQKSVVRDRSTGEVLGYTVRFKAYPGWVDRHTVGRIGQVLWACDGGGAQEVHLMERTLVPAAED